jgi:hypothetical protein
MTYRRFFYSSFGQRLTRPIGVFVIVCYTIAVLTFAVETGLSSVTLILLGSWIVVGIPVFVGSLNSWPEIRASDDYLSIRYLFSWLQIPWNEVLGLTMRETRLLGRFCVVYFRKLPFLLRRYQRNPAPYAGESEITTPFLVIYEGITDYEDLVAIIKAKTEDPMAKLYL